MNKYKLEDKIVFVEGASDLGDNTEIMTVEHIWDSGQIWGGYCGEIYEPHQIRLATHKEIKVGKRLP